MADRKLNSLTFPTLPDRYILDAGRVKYNDSDAFAGGTVGKALQEKTEGIENLITASAVQTLENKVPYLFRQTPNAGHNELDTIVGGTVAWNQMIAISGLPSTDSVIKNNGDGSITLLQDVGSDTFKDLTTRPYLYKDHAYLITGGLNLYDATILGDTGKRDTICKALASGVLGTGRLYIPSGSISGTVYKMQLFDLTQMFGSTIADYFYNLEQSSAGAGVALFKTMFPKSYYPYNAGELISVSGLQSHDMTGFNQWDEEWENGYYSRDTGNKAGDSDTSYIRSKNFIPCLPNTAYYFKAPSAHANNQTYFGVLFYDADGNFLTATDGMMVGDVVYTTPSSAGYISFYVEIGSSGAVYQHDICINFSWSGTRNGEYEPYEKHSYPLDSTLTLRGVPKLDASNNVYYDGDVYEADGSVTRKYGVVDLASLSWNYMGSRAVATLSGVKTVSMYDYPNTLTPKWQAVTAATDIAQGEYALVDGDLYFYYDGSNSPTGILVYELATPTTETAESYQYAQVCDPNGTEEYVTTGIVPVGHDTKYPMTLSDIMPTASGNYVLKCTVTGGVATYEWVSES